MTEQRTPDGGAEPEADWLVIPEKVEYSWSSWEVPMTEPRAAGASLGRVLFDIFYDFHKSTPDIWEQMGHRDTWESIARAFLDRLEPCGDCGGDGGSEEHFLKPCPACSGSRFVIRDAG